MEIQTNEEPKKRSCWWLRLELRSYIFGGYVIVKSLVSLYIAVASLLRGSPVISAKYLNGLDKVQPNHAAMFPYVNFFLGIFCIIFATILIVGVAKRKSGFVLTFFIGWLALCILLLMGTIIIIQKFAESGQISLLGSFLSSPLMWISHIVNIYGLFVTFYTFKKIRGEQKQFAHGRLNES